MGKPLEGTIVVYAIADGVGRIRLDDGEELRFGVRALQGIVPAVGLRVEVGDTEPYPLGGRRALAVTLAEDKAVYEKHRKAFEKAQGEVMRRDLGRRAEEFDLTSRDIKAAAEQVGLKRAGTVRRAGTGRPAASRAGTARPSASRASTARPTSSRAATSKPAPKKRRRRTRG